MSAAFGGDYIALGRFRHRRKGKLLRCGRPDRDTGRDVATWHAGRFRINGHMGDALDPPRP